MAKETTKRVVEPKHVLIDEAKQRQKYGGLNMGAAFYGWLVSVGVGVLLTALLAGAGSAVALTANTTASSVAHHATTVGLVSGILLLLALAIAYYAGGYVAGRMSRFNGARQGMGVWGVGIVVAILLGAAGAIFGSEYNLLQQLNLPHIAVKQGSYTTAGIVTLILALLVSLIAAIVGGGVGVRYHQKVDRTGTRVI